MKEKLPLIVGIGLPILLVFYVILSSYLPALFVKPKYNFVYTTGNYYDYDINVVGGKVTINPRNYGNYSYSSNEPNLYLYDVSEDKSILITTNQAEDYYLDSSNKSPDGFTVERGDGGGGFFPFFWYDSYDNGYYLRGRGLNKKIQLSGDSYQFKLLGWITND